MLVNGLMVLCNNFLTFECLMKVIDLFACTEFSNYGLIKCGDRPHKA